MMAADQQMIGTVRLLREHAEKVLDTNELVIQQADLLAAGLSWDAIARSEVLHQQLKRLAGQFPQVGGLFLVASDGTVANGSGVFPATSINVSDRDYFSALRDGYLGAFISYAHQGRVTGGEQFNFARRRSTPDGTFDGVIEIAASPTYFWEAYRNVGSARASVVLVRDNGEQLAYYPTPMFSGPSAPSVLTANLPPGEPLLVSRLPSPYDAIDRRGAYQRIRGYPLIVGYSVPNTIIIANWRKTVILNGALIGTGSVLVALMAWSVLRGFRREEAAHVAFRAEVRRREQAETKMEQAKRMEVIGQLAAGIAHDFSNLLLVVSGNLELMRDAATPSQRKRIDTTLSATGRGAGLIRQMLTFARNQIVHPEILDLNGELRAFAPLLSSALGVNTSVDYHLTLKPTTCCIDRAELEFAILNIATNAGHAMLKGGRLEIDTDTLRVVDNAKCGLDLAPGIYLRLAFRDSGDGMAPEILSHAFEPFFTTREIGAGTGLGLSQVYGFAKQSGGLATVESLVGHGTTVSVYLPMLEANAFGKDARGRSVTAYS
jgi:two-component system NtrC family sensor kinase